LPTFNVFTGRHQLLSKGVVNASLDVNSIHTNASLAGIPVFGSDRPFDRRIQICIVKNDKRRVPAKFQRKLLDGSGALLHEQTAHRR
jgi:hypothetical protein